ncbi:MAG: FAD-dependent oxidoreductase [Planctomycetaceae bacterium TMED240]|nr:TIGR03364 family FAD-dependent oxidoreductase [Rhodopirellula sp.]OUX03820.1 MAG: FAD-dependent oxidoreductase [Planctomycetaceae bacterium TMED240]
MTRDEPLGNFDVAIVGGGIVGLAHAWRAVRRGYRVLLLERTQFAQGASVRNFGMIWPVGQPAGELYQIALQSREFWMQLGAQGVTSVEACGSLHLAHQPDELDVLEEFCKQQTHQVNMLTAQQVAERTRLANQAGLLGGMYSPTELRVDPRTASRSIAQWLAVEHQVECRFNTHVTSVVEGRIATADGEQWNADRVIVCSGSDLQTLYPSEFASSGLKLCKLQMLRTVPQEGIDEKTPHIASGLTLRHYTSFESCSAHRKLRERIQKDSPLLDHYGIHVMASVFPGGEVVLGDSHEYGEDISPFDKTEIDDLILQELRKVIQLDDWTIQQRWHGIYAKHGTLPVFEKQIEPKVHLFVGTGGAGMTMSFGLAEQAWQRWESEK